MLVCNVLEFERECIRELPAYMQFQSSYVLAICLAPNCLWCQVGGRDVLLANGATFGSGVFTATAANEACQYNSDSGCVILSRALQGKSGKSHADNTAHSWPAGDDCIVFRESAQLLPVFVIHYTEEAQEE
jgi:hypothetical protein